MQTLEWWVMGGGLALAFISYARNRHAEWEREQEAARDAASQRLIVVLDAAEVEVFKAQMAHDHPDLEWRETVCTGEHGTQHVFATDVFRHDLRLMPAGTALPDRPEGVVIPFRPRSKSQD
jgi:hypothetical protein